MTGELHHDPSPPGPFPRPDAAAILRAALSRAPHKIQHPQHGQAAGDCPKDTVHNSYDRLLIPLAHDSGSLPPAQPDGQTLQTPMMSSLTRDEIRRIVLDLIG